MFNFADVEVLLYNTEFIRRVKFSLLYRGEDHSVSSLRDTRISKRKSSERTHRYSYIKYSRIWTSRILRARSPRERDKNFISRRHTLQCATHNHEKWQSTLSWNEMRFFRLRDSVCINVYTFCSFLFYSLGRKSSTLWSHRGTCTVHRWKEVSRGTARAGRGAGGAVR